MESGTYGGTTTGGGVYGGGGATTGTTTTGGGGYGYKGKVPPDYVEENFQWELGGFLERGNSLYERLLKKERNYGGCYYDVRGRPARSYYGPGSTGKHPPIYGFIAMQAEIRTLEFWRSVIAECVVTFFYTALLCSVNTSSTLHTIQTNAALASGISMAVLTACFAQVSDCHANPSITLARTLTRHVSPLRSALYICAQCGGSIAGAALVYGVYSRIQDPVLETSGGAFGMEFVLTFFISYAFYVSRSGYKVDPLLIGLAYAGSLVAWKGSLNPARALGSVFVSKEEGRFAKHWIFWLGPALGALTGGFTFEYIFNPRKKKPTLTTTSYANMTSANLIPYGTAASTTIISNKIDDLNQHHHTSFSEEDMIDDLERAKQYKASNLMDYSENSAYNRSAYKRNAPYPESMYSGTKSLYNQNGASTAYETKSVYGELGSKSCYEGYDGVTAMDRDMSSLRRGVTSSRALTTVNGANNNNNRNHPAAATSALGSRRNPYDYLPEEPPGSNKPDIISSRKISNRNYSPTKYDDNTLRINDNFEKLDSTNANTPYRSGNTGTAAKSAGNEIYNDPNNYNDPLKRQPQSSAAVDNSNYGGRNGDFQRLGRHRGDFYSPSYNASYSQQNGCSITQSSYNNY